MRGMNIQPSFNAKLIVRDKAAFWLSSVQTWNYRCGVPLRINWRDNGSRYMTQITDGNYIPLTPGQLQDATSYLQSLAAAQTDSRLHRTLWTQIVCTLTWFLFARISTLFLPIGSSWSKQPDFDAIPPCVRDGSLLALGNRAGSILLLR
jgi:hypothetical protein